MSYDLEIWSTDRPVLHEAMPADKGWRGNDDHRAREGKTWQIICSAPSPVLPEDVPESISACLPGISYLTEIALEPISGPKSALKEMLLVARRIAKSSHGIVFDKQTDELTTPRGVKRFQVEPRSKRFAVLSLGWWFPGDILNNEQGVADLLKIFTTHMPEALPRRYGLYEPPNYQFADEGLDHLVSFLVDNSGGLGSVMYPHRPFVGLSIDSTSNELHPRLGFRCNRLSVECEASAVRQPGWQEGLRRFWLAVCNYLKPFYSEARTLKGFQRMGATYGSDMQTEIHPIRSWFWRGIPRELGHAVAIGDPYISLWPRAGEQGQRVGDLVVVDTGTWTESNNLVIDAPEGIRQVLTPEYSQRMGGWSITWATEYPQTWPFERPDDNSDGGH